MAIALTPEYRTLYWQGLEEKKKIGSADDPVLSELPDDLSAVTITQLDALLRFFKLKGKSLENILEKV